MIKTFIRSRNEMKCYPTKGINEKAKIKARRHREREMVNSASEEIKEQPRDDTNAKV